MSIQPPENLSLNNDKRLIVCADMAEFDAMNDQIFFWIKERDPSVSGDRWHVLGGTLSGRGL